MKRLNIFLFIFIIAVSLPLAYITVQSYRSLRLEELGQLRFFSETLLDRMEVELAGLIQTEENRSVDEYQYFLAPPIQQQTGDPPRSPLSYPDDRDYILGYLQINPDGSWQTPLTSGNEEVPVSTKGIVEKLRRINTDFANRKIPLLSQQTELYGLEESVKEEIDNRSDNFSDRYLNRSKNSNPLKYLGKKKQRVEEITAQQAVNVSGETQTTRDFPGRRQEINTGNDGVGSYHEDTTHTPSSSEEKLSHVTPEAEGLTTNARFSSENFQVEVAPFQSVVVGVGQVYIFRRIVINSQIYRQGFVLLVKPFVNHLITSHFFGQPLAAYTRIAILPRNQGFSDNNSTSPHEKLASRVFLPPFDFVEVSLQGLSLPPSPARNSLTIAITVLGVALSLGLLTIYLSVRAIVALSERRSQFVSSVTHELKTPLTNIQMYVEMLEQGIGVTPEREQEYLTTLNTESARLSALINNVLELAKLEKGKRYFHMQEGVLTEVLEELRGVMAGKLRQHGVQLIIRSESVPPFFYDRDVLLQILINLVDNSIKFCEYSPVKKILIRVDSSGERVRIAVADKGPGIPTGVLNKIFDEFYRVDNSLTRKTGGTGIGLALVKQFVVAMGGTVSAANNKGPGCTISILLPSNKNI